MNYKTYRIIKKVIEIVKGIIVLCIVFAFLLALAYINTKRNGNLDGKVKNYTIEKDGNGDNVINYTSEVWGKEYNKRIVIPNVE